MKSIIEKVKSAKKRSLTEEEKELRRNMKISSGILIFFILTKYYLFRDVGVDFLLGWIGIPIVAGILAYQHTRNFGWKGLLGCLLVIPLSFNYATPLFPMRSFPTPVPGIFSIICCTIGFYMNMALKKKGVLLTVTYLLYGLLAISFILLFNLDYKYASLSGVFISYFFIPFSAMALAYCYTRLYSWKGLLSLIFLIPVGLVHYKYDENGTIRYVHLTDTFFLPIISAIVGLTITLIASKLKEKEVSKETKESTDNNSTETEEK